MKSQSGDAGVGMLVIMVVMMIGFWVASGHGGGGYHSKESVTNEPDSDALISSRSNSVSPALPGERLVNDN